jgi:hypothetical protein
MKMPPKSPDLDHAKEQLHKRFVTYERELLKITDELANSGFADRRWCAIARTHFEEGVMALHRALRDFPGDDPNQYGKVPSVTSPGFEPPPVDDAPNYSEAQRLLKDSP